MISQKRSKWLEVAIWVLLVLSPFFLAFDCADDFNGTTGDLLPESEAELAVCNKGLGSPTEDKVRSCHSYIKFRNVTTSNAGEIRADFEAQYLPPRAPASGSPCPPIVFDQPSAQFTVDFDTANSSTIPLLLYRQTNGSFSAQGFRLKDKVATRLGTLTQAQTFFGKCAASPWTPTPHPSILAEIPGTSSRSSLVTTFGGPLPYAGVNIGTSSVTVSLDTQDTLSQKKTDYAVGTTPTGLLAADFNGDGKRDLAVLNQGASPGNGSVSLLLGNGDGTLRTAVNFAVGRRPTSMTWFDFNKDGRADLAVANKDSHNVTILLGNADGTMTTAATYEVAGAFADANDKIVSGDFDGDGTADLIWFSVGNLYLFHGNGNGTFVLKPQLAGYKPVYAPRYLAGGDFNKDGKLDLVSVNYDATVAVLLNAGDGSFPNQSRYVVGTPFSVGNVFSPGVFVMDFNDDGKLDLVFASGHPDALNPNPVGVTILFGIGDGTFQAPPSFPVGFAPTSMASADFNGDGRRDLAVAASGSTNRAAFWILLGRSGGGFQPATELPALSEVAWVTTADMNGDGLTDLVYVDRFAVYIRLGKGDGTFQEAASTDTGIGATFVTVGDVNGDGRPDVLISYGYLQNAPSVGTPNTARLLLGKAGGGFQAFTTVPTGINTIQLALADVNGDGKLDLIAVNLGFPALTPSIRGNVTVSLGNGNGTFQAPANVTVGLIQTSALVADVNGDGKRDLLIGVLSQDSPQIAVLLGTGNGTFGNPKLFDTYSHAIGLSLSDFDRDGKSDLVIVHRGGDDPVTVMRGNGDGTFQAEALVMAGDTPLAVIAADFSGTGRPDLAVLNHTSVGNGSVGLFKNLSAGAACTYSLGANPAPFPATGGSGTLTVTSGSGCEWIAATPNPDWISITEGALGSGTGTVKYTVQPNSGGPRSGNINAGGQTLAITQGANSGSGPRVVSADPAAGSSATQTFTFTFTDPGGFQAINVANVLINNFINGIGACYVAIVPSSASAAAVYLVDNAGNAGGPYEGMTLPGSGTIQNSQCSITGTGSSVAGSGNNLVVTLAITFKTAFSGNRIIHLAAREAGGANSDWQAVATWNVPGANPAGPSVGGVTPGRSSGSAAQTFTFTFNDSNGVADLGVLNVLINNALTGVQSCYLAYVRSGNVIYLVNDGVLSAGLVVDGSAGSINNGQCTVSGQGSSANGSGNTFTLTLKLTFAAGFAGNRIIYAAARSNGDALNSGWQAIGSRTVTATVTPGSQATAASVAAWPNGRTFNGNLPASAIDGSTDTFTWTTNSSNLQAPCYLGLDFGASKAINRIRLFKSADGGGGQDMKNLTIEYTTSAVSTPLASRVWTPVTGLINGLNGTELLTATAVNANGTVTADAHNSAASGWASLIFDRVNATGIRIGFANPGGPTFNNHYYVNEFTAYNDLP